MHPFKSFLERFLRDGDSGGGGGDSDNGIDGATSPGQDQTGGIGPGSTEAGGSEATGGAGEGAGGEAEAPSATATENVGVAAAANVGTAPSAAPGVAATSNVGTTSATPSAIGTQEENATVSPEVSAPQGFANVSNTSVSDAMTEEEAIAVDVSQSVQNQAIGVPGVQTAQNTTLGVQNNNISTPTGPNTQTSTTPGPEISTVAGTMSLGGYATTGVNPDMGTTATSQSETTSSGTEATGVQGTSTATTDEGTAPATEAPATEAPATEAPATDTTTEPGATTGGTTGDAAGSPSGSPSGSEGGETSGGQVQGAPAPQSFSTIGSPTGAVTGVTSFSDVLSAIAGAVNPVGSAQAQVVDPNTGGIGGGQGQQGQTEEEEGKTSKSQAKGQSFGNIALGKLEGETGPNVQNAIKNAIRSLVGAPQVAPPAPPALPGMPGAPGAPGVPGVSPNSMITGQPLPSVGVVTPTPPPLPWAGQTQAPPLSGVEAAGIAGAQKGVVGGTPKGFAGVAPAQPPAPAMPPSTPRNRGMIGPPTAVSVPKGFPGGIGVSPSSSEETKEKVEALVAPKTVQQILNAPPIKTYPAMPPANVPGVLDRMGKGQPGVMSQSGDGTGGPGTPGAKGQNPGVTGQVTQQSPVPALPTNFGNVAQAPPATPPSVVPALPMPASITTTQQPTEETMPAATIDKSAPQSFSSALAAANKNMSVKEGMTTIGKLREQAVAVLGNPNASEEDQATAKSYMEKTNAIANPGAMNVSGVAPSVQANQQAQGTAKGIAGNPSVGLIDKAFVGAQVNPVTLSTATDVVTSALRTGSMAGIPGISTVAGLAARGTGKFGGSTQGATLGQEEAPAGTPGATTPWGGDDGYGDTRGDNSGFGRIAGLSSGARLAEAGYDGVSSFASIGSAPLAGGVDYGLIAGDAFSALGYSLPGEVDDPGIPEIGRRKTNSFLLRRVA